MPRIPVALTVAAMIFAAACEKHATVLPTDPTPPPGAQTLVITIQSDRGNLEAGSTSPANLTVTAKFENGTNAADGTDLAISTSLGNFGPDGSGNPVKLKTMKLAGGAAVVQFYAGTEVGTANVMAQVGTNSGRLNLTIVQPATAPVADFNVEVNGLKAIFTDASTGTITSRLWEFGDGTTSAETNPVYEYRSAGVYTAKLTVANSGGSTSKTKFVTVTSGPPLVASFTYAANGLTVLFTDTSTGGPTSWQWDFGDGKPFETAQNAQHVYERAGTYIVFLTVRNATSSATTSQFLTVGGAAPVADFTFTTNGLTANFTDTSANAPTSWRWNFGDNTAEVTAQNPSHTYAAAGTYNVTLTATNVGGSTSKSQFVTVSLGDTPKPGFKFTVSGLEVAFEDSSTGATSWDWDFGDNSAHSTAQNPTHSYTAGGTYTVTQTVTNSAGSASISQFVTVVAPPVADFTHSITSSNTLAVNFLDRSTNSPTAWTWNFGDCNFSTACTDTRQNPAHVYGSPGSYTVLLTVRNSAGQDTQQRTITVGAPRASFTYTKAGLVVTFTNTSTQSPTSYLWNFGDCSTNASCTSSEASPSHTYLAAGTFNVTLSVTNAGGSNSTTQAVTVP